MTDGVLADLRRPVGMGYWLTDKQEYIGLKEGRHKMNMKAIPRSTSVCKLTGEALALLWSGFRFVPYPSLDSINYYCIDSRSNSIDSWHQVIETFNE